ncbi:hypothetical protein Val02_68930 [Virgisporangium aliadipatigenens]|uniref:Uncharacterized protein n=1 Tax=Virgisporangium aliadipatigenens TaxID=741659 RepID=A0A8J4DVC6_9ACTN|nr:hypothetical protein [Virgisporangium aliadipatigenens]GIJ50007.1 hypothetical protein Val02_68930 [Virgisporangium aliadipatigenens]
MTTTYFATIVIDNTMPLGDLIGRLLVIRPTAHLDRVAVPGGFAEGIRVDVIDVDGTDPATGDQGALRRDVVWCNPRLVEALKPHIGDLILARLTTGAAKPGQHPPCLLADATSDPVAVRPHFL